MQGHSKQDATRDSGTANGRPSRRSDRPGPGDGRKVPSRLDGRLAPQPSKLAGLAAISVLGHALVLLSLDIWVVTGEGGQGGLGARSAMASTAPPSGRKAIGPPSCEADAALGTAAQLVFCTTPFGDRSQCVSDVLTHFRASQITCNAIAMPNAEIELIERKELARLDDEIEPEALLDLVTPEKLVVLQEIQQQQAAQEQREQAARRPPPPRPPLDAQVVEVVKPSEEEAPEDTRFLSEFDSKVEKQTVARGSRKEEMVAKPEEAGLKAKDNPREASIKEVPDAPTIDEEVRKQPRELAMRDPGPRQDKQDEQVELKKGALDGSKSESSIAGFKQRKGDGAVAQERKERREAGGGGSSGPPLIPNLRPSQEILERTAGGGSVDHLEDVSEGDVTALNSKAWKYAAFLNRVKRQVAQEWNPGQLYLRKDPNGNVYGIKDRVTQVHVSLSPQGKIVKIYIVRGSGVDFLDEEAIRAFRAAQPFPNPPGGMMEGKSQLINFLFSFHVETGGLRNWRIQRRR